MDKKRLDVALTETTGRSRSYIEKLIRSGAACVEDVIVTKPGTIVNTGQHITLAIPEPVPLELTPEPMSLTILYEDDDIACIVKPCGLVVHPAAGHAQGTLVHGLLAQLEGLSGIGGSQRPGIVHRLDKDTSGLMLIAKHDTAHIRLTKMLADRAIQKTYLAVAQGHFKDSEGLIDGPIGRHPKNRKKMAVLPLARPAQSKYRVRSHLRNAAYLEVDLITGRTHQIRVHMAWVGHPLLGDSLYGDPKSKSRLMLLQY